MLRSAEKALRSSREVVCCSKQPPAPRWDAVSLARCCGAGGVAGKTKKRAQLHHWWTDWLSGGLASRLADWEAVKMFTGQASGGGYGDCYWRGRGGTPLLSSVSSYNSSCPSSSSPSDSTSSRSSKSWKTEVGGRGEGCRSLARNLSNVLSMQSCSSTVRIDLHNRAWCLTDFFG